MQRAPPPHLSPDSTQMYLTPQRWDILHLTAHPRHLSRHLPQATFLEASGRKRQQVCIGADKHHLRPGIPPPALQPRPPGCSQGEEAPGSHHGPCLLAPSTRTPIHRAGCQLVGGWRWGPRSSSSTAGPKRTHRGTQTLDQRQRRRAVGGTRTPVCTPVTREGQPGNAAFRIRG